MKNFIRLASAALLLSVIVTVLSGCFYIEEFYFEEEDISLELGESITIALLSTESGSIVGQVIYASSDPSIATVSTNGVVRGARCGTVTIYGQSAENPKLRAEMKVTVYSTPVDELHTSVDAERYSSDCTAFPFWSHNGYSERVDNWDVMNVAKIIVTKGVDEYVFTDTYRVGRVSHDLACDLTGWGTESSVFETVNLADFDFEHRAAEMLGLDPGEIDQYGIDSSERELREYLIETQRALQNEVDLGAYEAGFEYRAVIRMSYTVYEVEDYYSHGTLMGLGSLVWDLVRLDVESLLDSYTYSETHYELVLDSVGFCIERREVMA